MPDDALDRYHELLLNDPEEDAPQNKLYGLKYCALASSFMLIVFTRFAMSFNGNDSIKYIDYQSVIPITIAFIVSCYSSFIGHKKLFIGSFISYSLCFMIIVSLYFEKSAILLFILKLSREIFNIQIYIQICGQWPQQFVRVFVEILLLSLSLLLFYSFSMIQVDNRLFEQNFTLTCIFLFPAVLFNIIIGVSSFRQPSTKSIHKDIIKAVFHYKPLIFTLLFASTFLLIIFQAKYFSIEQSIIQESCYDNCQHYGQDNELLLGLLLSPFLIFLTRKLKYQSTLIFAVVILILEILGILLLAGIAQFRFGFVLMVFLPINFIAYCLVYTIPQYQVILRSIDIKNLDFASSYQQFAFTLISMSVSSLMFLNLDIIKNNIEIWLLSSMSLVLVLGIIFYGALGYKQYFYKSNQSLVQEQELEASQI